MKVEVPSGELVSVSYSQMTRQRQKIEIELEMKRLLVFLKDKIFVDSFTPTRGTFTSVYHISPEAGNIVYGSFVHNQKAKHFLTLSELSGSYFIRTYSISCGFADCGLTTMDKSKKRILKRLRQLDPNLFHQWANVKRETEKASCSADSCLVNTISDQEYRINQREVSELEELKGHELCCVKMVKNVACGESELIISSESVLLTATINKKFILLKKSQNNCRRILGIEYWSGYYFFLYEGNSLRISKKGINGKFEEIKMMDFPMSELKHGMRITQLKIPKLEWSGSLPDILHKDLPAHILLVGTFTEDVTIKSCLIKYNIYTNQCIALSVVDTAAQVTAINFGPYDNGPIMVGLSDGTIIIYDYYSLEIIQQIKRMVQGRIKWLTYEPGNSVIIGTDDGVYKCDFIQLSKVEPVKDLVKHR